MIDTFLLLDLKLILMITYLPAVDVFDGCLAEEEVDEVPVH